MPQKPLSRAAAGIIWETLCETRTMLAVGNRAGVSHQTVGDAFRPDGHASSRTSTAASADTVLHALVTFLEIGRPDVVERVLSAYGARPHRIVLELPDPLPEQDVAGAWLDTSAAIGDAARELADALANDGVIDSEERPRVIGALHEALSAIMRTMRHADDHGQI